MLIYFLDFQVHEYIFITELGTFQRNILLYTYFKEIFFIILNKL